jgi:nicotinate-nucleotide--dimethylbenzimidazole phosphoribosyltransferase
VVGDLILVVGGQKSGKSGFAAARASRQANEVAVITPAEATDPEMIERIARHRADRPASWQTFETFDLADALGRAGSTTATVIVDALDTWLVHAMQTHDLWTDADVEPLGRDGMAAVERLLDEVGEVVAAAQGRGGETIVIAGELGSALAPLGAGTRRYIDLHGRILQRLAAAATEAFLVVAGRAIPLPPTEPTHPKTRHVSSAFDDVAALVAAVSPASSDAAAAARAHLDALAKPPGSLGRLEDLAARLAAIAATSPPPIPAGPALLVACGDHGVHAQGVTPWPQAVTTAVVDAVCAGIAASGPLARQVGATTTVLDVGVANALRDHPNLQRTKLRDGTDDLMIEPAMTLADAEAAILAGANAVAGLVDAGADLIVLGEVGMANTTPSACLIAAMTGADADQVTGRGTGIDDATHERKIEVVAKALARHGDGREPLDVLASLGGLEHAALVGACLAGAVGRIPVILDGVSTNAAAMVAVALAPEVAGYLVAGHASTEPGATLALTRLELDPLLDLGMRLGEGTGALLAVPIVQAAARVMAETAKLDDLL